MRVSWVLAIGLLALYASLAWSARIAGVSYSNDDAIYMMLARELSHFSYRESYLVGAPIHAQYPPGWPALLAVVGSLTAYSVGASYALATLLSVVALTLVFDAARRLWSPLIALLVLATAALCPAVVSYGGRVMSESAFMFWTALCLWAVARPNPSRRYLILAGFAAIMAGLTRSIGITLVVALALTWMLERRWRALAVYSLASVVTIGSWIAWTIVAPRQVVGRSYVADATNQIESLTSHDSVLLQFLKLAVRRLAVQVTGNLPAIVPLPTIEGTPIDNLVHLLIVVGLGGLGIWALWRAWRPLVLYLLGYFALLSIWPFAPRRFMIPLQPFLVVLLIAGALEIGRRWNRKAGTLIAVGLATLILVAAVPQTWALVRKGLECDRSTPWTSLGCYSPDQQSFFAAVTYVRRNTPDSAVLLVEREAAFAYHSGRTVVHAETVLYQPDREFLAALDRLGINYVLLGRLTDVEVLRLSRKLLDTCGAFDLAASFPPHTLLLRYTGGTDAAPKSDACEALGNYVATTPPRGWIQ